MSSSVMVLFVSNSDLGLEHAYFRKGNVSTLEVIVMLERSPSRGEMVVRRTMSLFEAREFLTHSHLRLKHSSKVPSREDAVVRDSMIHRVRLVVVQVLEITGIRVAEIEGKERVSIIYAVQFLAIHELLNILLDNRSLVDSSCLGSGGIDTNAITKGEDVLITLVLKSIWVDIYDTFLIGNTWGNKLLMRLAGRVNHTSEEVLLDNLSWVDVAEGCNLLTVLVLSDLNHFPSEEDFDSSLLALFKSNLVSIWELEDLLVGSPILNAGIFGCTSLKNILPKEVLVIESIEVRAFTLVWEGRRIADHVTVGMVPSMIIVVINSFLVINSMNEDVAQRIICKIREALNMFNFVLETSGQNESLVGVFSSVAELQLVVVGLELRNLSKSVHTRPGLDLGRNSCTLKFKFSNVTMSNTEVWLR
jgi:hypothetical protein